LDQDNVARENHAGKSFVDAPRKLLRELCLKSRVWNPYKLNFDTRGSRNTEKYKKGKKNDFNYHQINSEGTYSSPFG
jgi:hypothetical protein